MPSQKKIYGLIGYPVKHSLSALMHNAAFEALGINAEYRLFEIEPSKLEGFLLGNIKVKDARGEEVDSAEVIGFNITIPHKVPAFILVKDTTLRSGPDLSAVMTGAINTVKRGNDRLDCVNTDVKGFTDSLINDLKFNTTDKSALVLGCGGAGRAIVAGLLSDGLSIKRIYIYEAHQETARRAKQQFASGKTEFLSSMEDVAGKISEAGLLVNATPVGMKEGDASPVSKQLLRKDLYVYDVVYNRETQLIREAKEAGCAAVGGLGMLLYQGAAAFEFWTGQKAPLEIMREKLEEGVRGL